MLFALHFSAHVRWKYSKSYDKKSWYPSVPSLYSMLDLPFRQWPVDPGYLLSLGGEWETTKLYVGIFFRKKKRNPRNLKNTSLAFDGNGSSQWFTTLPSPSHHFWEGDFKASPTESVVAKKLRFRCYQVCYVLCFVLFRWWDGNFWPPKINTKTTYVIHVPFLTKILFFPNELKPPPNVTHSLGFVQGDFLRCTMGNHHQSCS